MIAALVRRACGGGLFHSIHKTPLLLGTTPSNHSTCPGLMASLTTSVLGLMAKLGRLKKVGGIATTCGDEATKRSKGA